MLQLILMFLGLAFPTTNSNTSTTDNQSTTVIAQNTEPGDTGGETQVPPKK